MARHTLTLSLPRELARQVERARKAEQRTTSELMREALRTYFESRAYTPTLAELRAIEKGRAALRRGSYYTRGQFRAHVLGSASKKASTKKRAARS